VRRIASPTDSTTPARTIAPATASSATAFAPTGVPATWVRYPPNPSATVAMPRRSAASMSQPARNPTRGPNASAVYWNSGASFGRMAPSRA
jgi:hypothetical protein